MAKPPKPAAKSAKGSTGLQAYCMKTKQKEDFVGAPTIVKTERNQYIVRGETAEGHKIALIVSEENANKLVKDKTCKKGW